MPFKPNYRLERAGRRRAKEEQQQKKLLKRAERDASGKSATPSELADDAPDGGAATPDTESST